MARHHIAKRALGMGALVLVASLLVAPLWPNPAAAQEPLDDATLEEIRATVPTGYPGAFDLPSASAQFSVLAALVGDSTSVDNLGDASQLTGLCGGWVYSYNKDGLLIDAAVDVGNDAPPVDLLDGIQAFTASNRFEVDPRGAVVYYGFSPESGDGPLNHRWYIKTSGISVDRGGDPNDELKNRNTGIVDLGQDLPVKFTANITIEAKMESQNQPDCFGIGHVAVVGDGLSGPFGIAGLALLGGGIVGLLFNARPAYTYSA